MNFFIRKILSVMAICTCVTTATYAQFDVVFEFDSEDATAYLKAYSEPTVAAFSNGLTGGWYNTAKPHKLLGFDLTMTANLALIPEEDKFFDFNSINWNNLELASGSNNLPTLNGDETDSRLSIPGGTINGFPTGDQEVDAADGAGFGFGGGIPVPAFQLGIGIVKNTDLKLRLIPAVDFGDGEFSLWGVGVMHDVKQWIPGIKSLPFDLSVLVGHTSLNLSYNIDENEGNFSAKGESIFKVNSTTFQALISKKISVLTPYVGLGFNSVKSQMDLSDVVVTANSGGFSDEVRFGNIDYEGSGSARLTAGLRLKLAVITFHFDYTVQKYSMLTAGFGINVR